MAGQLRDMLDPPGPDRRRRELARLEVVRAELAGLQPTGQLTAAALDELRQHFAARIAALEAVGAPGPVAAEAAEPVPAPAPRASLQEFLAERSILIVSQVGAFLLIVATVLFEIYGPDWLSG